MKAFSWGTIRNYASVLIIKCIARSIIDLCAGIQGGTAKSLGAKVRIARIAKNFYQKILEKKKIIIHFFWRFFHELILKKKKLI